MRKKITIIGVGNVDATLALWSALKALGDSVLFNRTKGLAQGKTLDLKEATPLEAIVRDTCVPIAKFPSEAVLIMVTNPIDAMVHMAARRPSQSAG